MKPFRVLLLALCLAASPLAHAIGDSGGCNPDQTPLGQALMSGTPAQLEAALLRLVDGAEQRRSLGSRIATWFGGEQKRQAWRQHKLLNLIEGRNEDGETCLPGVLLPMAMWAGNQEVVRFLLGEPMGLRVRVPPDVLFTCERAYSYMGEDRRARRRAAFALVLDAGVVYVNSKNRDGYTVMQACRDPQLLSLFLEHGASVRIEWGSGVYRRNLLDQAILDALGTAESRDGSDHGYVVERVRLLSTALPNSIRGRPVEQRVRQLCNQTVGDKPWNPRTCLILAGLIEASQGTFGPR